MKFLDDVRKVYMEGEEDKDYLSMLDNIDDPVAVTNNLMNAQPRVKYKGYNYMRMSEIDRACPREWVIGYRKTQKVKDVARFANLVVMDLGSALHWWLQNTPTYFGDKRIGYWKCIACGNTRFGAPPTTACEVCGAKPSAFFYDEYMFRLKEPFRVVGKLDMILAIGGKYRAVEIKSHAGNRPIPQGAHISQLCGYIHYCQNDPNIPVPIDPSIGYLVYINKNFSYSQPILSYPIRPTKTVIEKLDSKVSAYTHGTITGELPLPLNDCVGSNWTSSRAKNCPMRTLCKKLYSEGITKI